MWEQWGREADALAECCRWCWVLLCEDGMPATPHTGLQDMGQWIVEYRNCSIRLQTGTRTLEASHAGTYYLWHLVFGSWHTWD